ncbi:MAG: thiamine ABC transporter substrate-binding protein [Bifidobacteriaceae bacterium]|jgi:thiamine transport system substrate-binding protein|nr:thiamine ABC transporter substrate-binding protein [Bifidobacteriaceae bacterium]
MVRWAAAALVAATLAGCSGIVGDDAGPRDGTDTTPAQVAGSPDTPADGGTVRLVTHDSFAVSDGVFDQFTADTGYTVEVIPVGDAGSLVNQLILTKDNPVGDAVFGIDTTFASRAISQDVLAGLQATAVPGAETFAADGEGYLAPIDYSDVCVNIDHEWFAEAGITEPVALEDLTKAEYKDLLVVENPATSSPGLAFLLATVAAFGEDGWRDYWTALSGNGLRAVDGWSDAYYVDFSGPSSQGDRPLVVSYASSPPAEVPDGATVAPTGALPETCFRQVEYAGVLSGAANPQGASALVDFLGSVTFQSDIPESMWVYPVNTDAPLPEAWVEFAPLADEPWSLPADEISASRERWIEEWTATVVG